MYVILIFLVNLSTLAITIHLRDLANFCNAFLFSFEF